MTQQAVYSPEEVARRLRVSEETVRREIRAATLGAQRVGKQYRIAPSDLIAYLGVERYREWFTNGLALNDVIGVGGLDDAEAQAIAEREVRAVRVAQPEPRAGRPAPAPATVRAHLKARRAARAVRD
jgi:excisionase family DNA binding protein